MQIKVQATSEHRQLEWLLDVPFRPGDHKAEHLRLAVGHLLAELEAGSAQITPAPHGLQVMVGEERFVLR